MLTLLGLAAAPLLAGCVGDTDPATHIRATSAQLNAHGHSNNGPATFWFEYGTSKATVTGGGGTRTPTHGPANVATDVKVSETLNGLDPGQPYYFRACGQDTAAGSSATCGRVRSLRTSPTDSTLTVQRPASGTPVVRYVGSPATSHSVNVNQFPSGYTYVGEFLDVYPTDRDPPEGGTFVPNADCSLIDSDSFPAGYDDEARCGTTTSVFNFDATLGPYDDDLFLNRVNAYTVHAGAGNDTVSVFSEDDQPGGPGTIYGEGGNDRLVGGEAANTIYGGAGDDTLIGGSADDTLDGGPGNDTYTCYGGNDTAIVDSSAEAANASANGCENVVNAAARKQARR